MATAEHIALFQAIIMFIGLALAIWQLHLAVKALKTSAAANQHSSESGEVAQLMLVLAIENQLSETKVQADEAQDSDCSGRHTFRYLDCLNRFCHCIRLGFVDELVYKIDYQERIKKAIRDNPRFFDSASDFQHVLHVNQCWVNDKNPVDRKTLRRSQSPGAPS